MPRSRTPEEQQLRDIMQKLHAKFPEDFGRAYSEVVESTLRQRLVTKFGERYRHSRISEMLLWPKKYLYAGSQFNTEIMNWENQRPPGCDHESLFNGPRGFTFVMEPYHLNTGAFLELADYCREHSLEIEITTGSPHYATRCLLIKMWLKSDADRT